jgi:hypothetical protein
MRWSDATYLDDQDMWRLCFLLELSEVVFSVVQQCGAF